MSAAAILAITAGLMLYYVFTAWRRNLAELREQEDAAVTIYTLVRNVRGAKAVAAELLPTVLQTTNAAGIAARFYVDANTERLYHMPNVADPAQVVRVSDLPVADFAATPTDDGVEVSLTLRGRERTVAKRAFIHLRN